MNTPVATIRLVASSVALTLGFSRLAEILEPSAGFPVLDNPDLKVGMACTMPTWMPEHLNVS